MKAGAWFRRHVPVGYVSTQLKLVGLSPLLMNSGEYDRDGELFRSYWSLGQKKRKSLDDDARLRELEWKLRIYLDDDIGPYIPGKNIKEMLREAATKWRKGEDIVRSLVVIENRIPLLYEGPRDEAGLWDGAFRYTTMVANAGAGSGRVPRCRPKFDEWELVCELAYDPEDLDHDLLELVVERSKKYGLGDGRKIGFGSFEAYLDGVLIEKKGAQGSAAKTVDEVEANGHKAQVDRIKATT